MAQKGLTPQEFFDKCREVHGKDAYDYSNAVYLSTKKKVTHIKCNHCGHIFDMIDRNEKFQNKHYHRLGITASVPAIDTQLNMLVTLR